MPEDLHSRNCALSFSMEVLVYYHKSSLYPSTQLAKQMNKQQ